jgi:hypothetical protein
MRHRCRDLRPALDSATGQIATVAVKVGIRNEILGAMALGVRLGIGSVCIRTPVRQGIRPSSWSCPILIDGCRAPSRRAWT